MSTSALEGTHASFEDVLEADVEEDSLPGPAIKEVLNYVRVAELALDQIKERPVTIGMLSELQSLLVRGTPAESSDSGKVRALQVVVGTPGGSAEDAGYVPPPPGDQLVAGLRHWELWIEERPAIEPVVAVALAHYQFEALHPFHDGNGRLGRLVVMLHLVRRNVLHDGLLTISPWLEQRRAEYQDHLLSVSQTGDFEPWIRFFAEGLRARADAATSQIERLLSFQETTRDLTRAFPLRGVAAQIADDLIGRPVATVASASRRYDVSFQAANTAMARLVEAGLLREVTGRRYRRAFASDEVLGLVQS